eukprot:768066-Hanusia_phi.AAC.8
MWGAGRKEGEGRQEEMTPDGSLRRRRMKEEERVRRSKSRQHLTQLQPPANLSHLVAQARITLQLKLTLLLVHEEYQDHETGKEKRADDNGRDRRLNPLGMESVDVGYGQVPVVVRDLYIHCHAVSNGLSGGRDNLDRLHSLPSRITCVQSGEIEDDPLGFELCQNAAIVEEEGIVEQTRNESPKILAWHNLPAYSWNFRRIHGSCNVRIHKQWQPANQKVSSLHQEDRPCDRVFELGKPRS